MKIKVEIDPQLSETEVIVRTPKIDEQEINYLYDVIAEKNKKMKLKLFQGETTYYVNCNELLFFETSGRFIQAHTSSAVYDTHFKLYELEKLLPANFMRVSKSTILNTDQIFGLTHSLTNNLVEFQNTYKQVYVSRKYFKKLKDTLDSKEL
ncbi:MAG: LytTR family DNA-binding domain-containing protein [Liquorilactobacillus ghanensis]|uniref:Response regulator n=1 Tax=Liquorilactobacillus ghanensis DSM 18630 TaxID=1423750 RepID=A0A0R1VPW4_9LACO|nr:LytTR family DNA-binding domain-containing protein [Liquorilactobacillus ghanensis]KRM05284.1 response regulator [Liquorilactobacillus ghanensis DSM 18630]